jgi:nucleotide-binding universal stress UspA family protein
MNKILCPIDFSRTSVNALEYATRIAERFNSTIILLNVFTEKEFNKVYEEESLMKSYKELLAMANNKISALAQEVNKDLGNGAVRCEGRVVMSHLMDGILELIQEEHIDLVVMGTTGVSQYTTGFVGSNTIKVIEKTDVPVLCVPQGASFEGFNKIVYASAFQEEDKIALQEVISFATMFDARVNVLHISSKENLYEEAEFKSAVEDLGTFVQYSKLKFERKVYSDVTAGLETYMDDEDGDLLVLLTRHRNFFESIVHKSVTRKLSFITHNPLLILKQ